MKQPLVLLDKLQPRNIMYNLLLKQKTHLAPQSMYILEIFTVHHVELCFMLYVYDPYKSTSVLKSAGACIRHSSIKYSHCALLSVRAESNNLFCKEI